MKVRIPRKEEKSKNDIKTVILVQPKIWQSLQRVSENAEVKVRGESKI